MGKSRGSEFRKPFCLEPVDTSHVLLDHSASAIGRHLSYANGWKTFAADVFGLPASAEGQHTQCMWHGSILRNPPRRRPLVCPARGFLNSCYKSSYKGYWKGSY